MKRAGKFLSVFLAVWVAAALAGPCCFAEQKKAPVYAGDLNPGTYPVTVTSSASMFRVVHCELTVAEETMTAVLTLSGKGYGKLFLGTGAQAAEAPETAYIPFVADEAGAYTYTIPVQSLNTEFDCAAWSIRRARWYDRVLVVEGDTLPPEAFRKSGSLWVPLGVLAGVVVLGGAVTAYTVYKKQKKLRDTM